MTIHRIDAASIGDMWRSALRENFDLFLSDGSQVNRHIVEMDQNEAVRGDETEVGNYADAIGKFESIAIT